MSELLDKQVYVLNELEIPGFTPGVSQAHKKCAMKMKEERKKRWLYKNFFDDRKDFVWLLLKLDVTDVDELQDNNSSHTKGIICLEWAPKGWFFERGRMNGHHNTCNGWYLGLVVLISSIVGLPILYS